VEIVITFILGDPMTISHAGAWYRTRVTTMRGEWATNLPLHHSDALYPHVLRK